MKKIFLPFSLLLMLLSACIGDDIIFDTVAETLRITNPLDTLAVGDSYTLELLFTNNVGIEEVRTVSWSSTDPSVLLVDETGTLTGIAKGEATVIATLELADNTPLTVSRLIVVDQETVANNTGVRKGTIKTTSSYLLKGGFEISKEGTDLQIIIDDDYEASTALPGLYVYLTNNPSSTTGALEIGEVTVFKGTHIYTIGGDIALNQYDYLLYYCKPFNVKVGDGEIGD